MKIGLWSDNHNFPSLPLMKISAYHKRMGDHVEMLNHFEYYDKVYASKTFSFTPDVDELAMVYADEIQRGGTGYAIRVENGKEVYDCAKDTPLPEDIESIYPDYGLYPTYSYAVGFLTRGCPRGCGFCVVGKKEGLCSRQVADLEDIWRGQKELKLMDPNLLACKNHENLLLQLSLSSASVDFTQGIDLRLITKDNLALLNQVKTKRIHFAWDNPRVDMTEWLVFYAQHGRIKDPRRRTVYVLTNYNSSEEDDLNRIYAIKDVGYTPYVMIYDKNNAPYRVRLLQRWCNNPLIFKSCPNFKDYDPKKG